MLYKETVEPGTLGLLKDLMELKELEQFRLIGGTALSLLLGHRASIDLDLCTDKPFDIELITDTLSHTFPIFNHQEVKSPRLFFTYINNVKVDFVCTFEKFSYDYHTIENVRFASTEEIIALKLNAIAGRGAKKDFWDLHELLNHYSFEQMVSFYQRRYPNHSLMMIFKSLRYFEEAELDSDPKSFKNTNWETVKKEIINKFNTYIQNIN